MHALYIVNTMYKQGHAKSVLSEVYNSNRIKGEKNEKKAKMKTFQRNHGQRTGKDEHEANLFLTKATNQKFVEYRTIS